MDVKCCKCKKEYDLASNIFEYDKANCPILICPYCGFKHVINFMPFEKRIKVKKIKKLDLANPYFVILGASRIADASRVDQSNNDNGCVEAWGISSAIYAEKNKFVGSEDIYPRDVVFSPNGTKMYIMGDENDTIYQYTLSVAWNVSTASYADKSKFVGSEDSQPRNAAFNPDGTKMYILGHTNKTVYQYALSVAWDISTASYTGKSKFVGDEDTYSFGLAFSSDGTSMYIMGYINNTAYQYALSVAWDISTAIYADKSKDVREETGELMPYGIAFSSDGKKMYIVGYTTTVFQFTLSIAWDVSTATYPGKSKFVGSEDPSPFGIAFSSDGKKMYIMGLANSTVYQYTMPSSWVKTNDFILATRIYTSKGPIARAYKLRWRDITDEGVFVDVGATGEISYNAITDLVDGNDLLIDEKLCDEQDTAKRSPYFWQDGLESEGDNLLPDSGTYSLADEYYTEFQWALDCSNAEDEHEYEFELWDATEGVSVGTCLASITMAVAAGITHALISTAVIAVSTTSALSRGITENLLSTANILSSITGSLSRGVKEYLTSTSNIVTSTINSLSRGVKEALASTSNIATSITAVLSRGITETLNSTSAITTSITSALSRGIKAVLTSTVNITTSTVSVLSRGIKVILISTADIVVSMISRLSVFIKFLRAILSVDINDSILSINISGSILSIEVNGSVLLISYNESEFSIYNDDSEVSIYSNESILTIIE